MIKRLAIATLAASLAACQAAPAPQGETFHLVVKWDNGESDIADYGLTESDCNGATAYWAQDMRAVAVYCEVER